ncbi:MAG: hypothetical protein JOY51_03205, partial [Nevskia sp.]|nr:hypothetical protein [Nevskia sp.]
MKPLLLRGAVLALSVSPLAVQACATCGCSLSSDAALGYFTGGGWRLSLEYDFIDQDQLRYRYAPIPPSQVATINDQGGSQEVEHGTINRYLTAGISYAFNANWSLTTFLPYISRSHTTYGSAGSAELMPDQISGAHVTGLGDVKLIGTYQGFLPTHNLGVQFGVKLPTGRYGGQNLDTGAPVGRAPTYFSSGPNAGSALDTSLNPGTGSYDLIFGAYYFQPVSQNFDAFV